MSDYSGQIKRDVVKIRILKSTRESWYANKVGKVVEAMREITIDNDGSSRTSYKQWPPARGFEPSGHYNSHGIREVPDKPTNKSNREK